jgi:hypothetical protein
MIAPTAGVNVGRDTVRRARGAGVILVPRLPRGDFFSLGGVLAPYLTRRHTLAPWTLSAAVLVALASWDPVATGGGFDVTLLGLAAYELLIALTRRWSPSPSPPSSGALTV